MEHHLECQDCGATYPGGLEPLVCPECSERGDPGRLDVVPVPGTIDLDALPFGEGADREPSMWRYRELLPLFGDEPVSLEEGWTPLVESPRAAATANVDVLVKNETVNPTWSFKDRLNSVILSNVAAEGRSKVATSSTGNHGASTAAYASVAGIEETIVLLHPDAEPPGRLQVRSYGATAVVTVADARTGLLGALFERGWYPTTNTPDMPAGHPYGYEGYKTIAFEIAEQLSSVPDAVSVPTGSGDGFYGVWKGFVELRDLGVIDDVPRMIAVQPDTMAPLVEAIETGSTDVDVSSEAPPLTTSTATDSVCDHAIEAVDASNGDAIAVTRDEIVEALETTARDGVLLEPASALAPAGVAPAVAQGVVDEGDTVVCVGTGAGVKWPASLASAIGEVPTIDPDLDSLSEAHGRPLDG